MLVKKFYRKLNGYLRMVSAKGSSVSDDGRYPKAVHSFVEDETEFDNFRRNEIYMQIVECPTYEEGRKYLSIVNRIWPEWKNHKEEFLKNDQVGNPYIYEYDGVGKISAKLLQEILTLGEIQRVRPEISDVRTVAEIGVGYGSLARLLSVMFQPRKYFMYDLPDVLMLAKKYIERTGEFYSEIISNVAPVGGVKYDMVISNYAFSELSPELQKDYLQKALLKSKHGFIIYNPLAREKYRGGYSALELAYAIPNAVIYPLSESEEGDVFWHECCIVTW